VCVHACTNTHTHTHRPWRPARKKPLYFHLSHPSGSRMGASTSSSSLISPERSRRQRPPKIRTMMPAPLHLCSVPTEAYHMAKETYHMAKETYHMAKETYPRTYRALPLCGPSDAVFPTLPACTCLACAILGMRAAWRTCVSGNLRGPQVC
jgi:hypothetical protein